MARVSRLRSCWLIGLSALLLPTAACVNGQLDARPTAEGIWAIRCAAFQGNDRHRRADQCKQALQSVPDLQPKSVQALNIDREAVVYYGQYRREYDSRTAQTRFKPDPMPAMDLIRSLSMTVDGRLAFPFIYATMEELPTSRPGIAGWDLAQADGYWSVQVAVFFNDGVITNRRYLAEEYCRELRSEGAQAYYHHGPVHSSVCVGLFPERAVQTVRQTDPLTGVLQVTNRIVDERLLELQRKFPYSLQNGRRINDIVRDPQTGEIQQRIPLASFVVQVPRAEER